MRSSRLVVVVLCFVGSGFTARAEPLGASTPVLNSFPDAPVVQLVDLAADGQVPQPAPKDPDAEIKHPVDPEGHVVQSQDDVPQLPKDWKPESPIIRTDSRSSPYIPVDSWIYGAVWRLYGLGYADRAVMGLRPYTRLSLAHIMEQTADKLESHKQDLANEQAREIYHAIMKELTPDIEGAGPRKIGYAQLETVYTRFLGISGESLRDSFHLGQTIVNDYGRPYEPGFNMQTGFSASAQTGRFSLYFRGEYQHAPSATGYSSDLAQQLSLTDGVPYGANQATIPEGPIAGHNAFRILEANAAVHVWSHEISFGKSDEWMGPGLGASMAYSNNAEDIYSFRINRVEPLRIPLLSRVLGPVRYDFLVGSLKGHTYPNAPWVHAEKFSFKPTANFEFGFERTVMWGGEGHVPVTLHTFLRSFFSLDDTTGDQKFSRADPGARFTSFDFTYRLPFLRNWATLYTDSESHDDVTPVSAPRRAAVRPGIFLSHFPGASRLSLRVEGVNTDPPVRPSRGGGFMYRETVYRQGYTNKGQLFGDWMGREGKGGQAWLTYNFSGKSMVEFSYRNQKVAKDFVTYGTTLNDYRGTVITPIGKDFQLNAWIQYEGWKAPIYKQGLQNNVTTSFQITWLPGEKKRMTF